MTVYTDSTTKHVAVRGRDSSGDPKDLKNWIAPPSTSRPTRIADHKVGWIEAATARVQQGHRYSQLFAAEIKGW